ncbi:hypothetical protein R3W88_004810 [Solanum pinnatisectum]|uniref:Uncharacterized protein n=1 Tax=Solanum pinnatisectum TaxID=50273 RepID=A0AAV9KAS9_9SOLN|nr:hypothetical protein R3W88_004810 [Solanum pinnatisectum]
MIVADPDLNDTAKTEGTILRDPQYIRSHGWPHTTRSRGRMEYYFPSSQPRAGFGASNGGRTGVRGGGRGGKGGDNRGGRGSGRTNQSSDRGNGLDRGTSIEHDDSHMVMDIH